MPSPIPSSDCAPRGQRIDINAASERTGLSTKTLRRRIKDGSLRAYHVVGTRHPGGHRRPRRDVCALRRGVTCRC